MDKDLFGKNIEIVDSAYEELKNYDSNTFDERLLRLKEINSIFPFGNKEFGSDESFKIFNEAIHSYIFGQFISTIILAQSFIERRFQEYFHLRNDNKRAKMSMSQFIKEFKGTEFLPDYILLKINKIRLKRNPFVHHRNPLHTDSLMNRAITNEIQPVHLLHNDARESIEIMFHMVQRNII